MRVAPIKKISKILRQVSLPSFFAQKYWMKKSLVKTLMLLTELCLSDAMWENYFVIIYNNVLLFH